MSSSNTPTSSNQPTSGSSTADPMVLSDSSISTDESDLADGEVWNLRLKTHVVLPGAVLSVSSYLGQYVIASAGNCVSNVPLHNLCCMTIIWQLDAYGCVCTKDRKSVVHIAYL